MKLLKIESSKAQFLDKNEEYRDIDSIDKDDLLHLVKLSLEEQEVEFDDYSEQEIPNQAQNIIYVNIYKKLKDLTDERDAFKDGTAREFIEAYDKYKNDTTDDSQTAETTQQES